MAVDRKNYFIKLAAGNTQDSGINVGFRSPASIYDSIKTELGVQVVGESSAGYMLYGRAGEMLPRLSLKLDAGGLNTGLGNDAQSNGAKYIRVFVDPSFIELAFKDLIGKTTKGRRIVGVKFPKRRVYL